MTILVPLVTDEHDLQLAALKFTVDSTEAVDSYCTDYLISGMSTIDTEVLGRERIDDIRRVLSELDAIVKSSWEVALMDSTSANARVLGATVERARNLAAAIREALESATLLPLPRPARPARAGESPFVHDGFGAGAL